MKKETYFQRIASVMRDNQFDRVVTGFRSGKLGKKVYKVAMDNDRVFDRKQERKNKKYSVILMIDESGSMHGQKISVAAESATIMARALSHSNIDFCIMGFNAYIRIHKKFSDKIALKEFRNLQQEIISSVDLGGPCNHDWAAVVQLVETVKGLDPLHTIVMMFVDGQPACGCRCKAADPGKTLKPTADKLAKKCMFITFGVLTSGCEYYYPNVVYIGDLGEFMTRSLYALQNLIQRG